MSIPATRKIVEAANDPTEGAFPLQRRQILIGLSAATGSLLLGRLAEASPEEFGSRIGSYLERFDSTDPSDRWRLVRKWLSEDALHFLEELRTHRPILEMPEVTLATRFADCTSILRRHDAFTVDLYGPKQGDYWMAEDDTPVHAREKSIMQAILDREQIPAIRAFVAEKSGALLASADGRIDVVDGLSRAVPIGLVQSWFGFVDSDPKELFEWSYWNQIDAFWNQPFDSVVVPDPAAIVAKRKAANLRMRAYLMKLISRRVGELKDGQKNTDPVSRLLRLSLGGAVQFDIERVALNVGGLLIGAVETTSHAVINALAGIVASPDIAASACAAAQADETLEFDGYVFEALRFNPAFPYFFRTCKKETLLSGDTDHETKIQTGTTVLAMTYSAMFDATVFPNPERFDPNRPLGDMFHFGQGLHECLGKAIGQAIIPEIVRQCLRLKDLVALGPVDYRGGPVPESYQIQWSP